MKSNDEAITLRIRPLDFEAVMNVNDRGLGTVTNAVANAANIAALATKSSLPVVKLQLDFTQKSSADGRCN